MDKINTDEIFEVWAKQKKRFIDIFNGKYIYEVPEKISITLDESAQEERLKLFRSYLDQNGRFDDLAEFLSEQKEGFFNNKTTSISYTPRGKIIPKGSKLVRAFKHFVKDDKVLNDLQTFASTLIQENKIEGTLCFSVHPFDYLSMSENNHKWRSCHSLRGDYRSGCLSYMLDNVTVLCYIKSDEETILPNFPSTIPWNNKKWRMVLNISEDGDIIFAGRQYPFFSLEVLNIVKENFTKILKSNYIKITKWTEWENNIITEFNNVKLSADHILIGKAIAPIQTIIQDAPDSRHYNDLTRSSCYKPYYAYKVDRFWGCATWADILPPPIEIGARTPCVCCNATTYDAGTFLCVNCLDDYGDNSGEYYMCFCCNNDIQSHQGIFDPWTEKFVCYDCLEKYCSTCSSCGSIDLTENLIVTENGEEILCETCLKERR